MKTLKQLLGLCDHKWKQIEKSEVSRFLPSSRANSKCCIGFEYVLQCEKCGDLKKRSFTV